MAVTQGCPLVVLDAADGQVRFRAEGADCTRSFAVAGAHLHRLVGTGEEDDTGVTVLEHEGIVPD